jgi:hypothetical protein
MSALDSKQEADVYFERLASELESLADSMQTIRAEDRELAERLKEFAQQIRIDSGLQPACEPVAMRKAS